MASFGLFRGGPHAVLLLVVAAAAAVSAVDVQIWPDVPELTLTSGADFTLKCTGDVPVKWTIATNYDKSLLAEKNSTINISQGLANDSHISYLTLSRANYLDTGFYYCEPLPSEEVQFDEQYSKKIYIFIRHDTHLLVIPEALFLLNENEDGDIIIPCRPTSPDVNVTLFKNDEEMTEDENLEYDQKIGFTLRSPTVRDSGVIVCEANRNDINESRTLQVTINPKVNRVERPFIKSSDVYSDHVIAGQQLSLNCSVSMEIGVAFTLNWIVPDNDKLESGHVEVGKDYFFNLLKNGVSKRNMGSRMLKIHNVTFEDEGEYICEAKSHSKSKNHATYTLKVHSPDYTYLNLSIQESARTIVTKAGVSYIQWIVQVSAHPKPTFTWRDPNLKEVGMNPEKIAVINDKSTSKLVINDLQLYDSGVYELVADNGVHVERISVNLLVEDKPIVQIPNNSNLYYQVGKVHLVECYVAGYPLPSVEWAFKKCPNYPECENSFVTIPRHMYKETVLRETFLISTINITAAETGMLLCKASNSYGNANHSSTFLVTDVSKGLAINGPQLIVEGDNVTIECSVSKYNYLPDIVWLYRSFNSELKPITNNNGIFISHNKTLLSYHSYLIMTNIKNNSNGEYVCSLTESSVLDKVQISYSVTVRNAQIPVIRDEPLSNVWNVITGKTIQWKCYSSGMPPPTVLWFKNGKLLDLGHNNSRVLLRDRNQTLFIRFTAFEDEGFYVCNASNRIGSAISTHALNFTDKPEEHEHYGFILLCSVLIILLGILMIGCATHLKRERKLKKELALAGLLHFENGAVESWNPDLGIEEQAELLPYDKKWEFPRDKLKLGKQLGSGAFGVVFKAEAIDIIEKGTNTTVAVKMVKPNSDPSYIKALAAELKIMIHLGRHLNVVNLLGAYTGNLNKRELMVIVEYCRFGNIHQYLLKQRDCFVDQVTPDGYIDYNIKTISKNPYYVNVPNKANSSEKFDDDGTAIGTDGYLVPDVAEPEWRSNYRGDYKNLILKPSCTHDLICWSFQVARGMDYLASRKILHGDLATRNILLAEDNIVKICDFGFAKTMYNSENYKKKSDKDLLPVKWMAIESLRDRVFSTQSDVWAFGIVLWEIFSLAVTPYPNIQKFNELFQKLVEGYRMEQPKYANSEIYNIMLDCWKMNPMTRPSFNGLAERLGDLLQDGTKSHYLNLDEVYLRMNTYESPTTDYLSLLTAPTYLNCSTVSDNNSNSYPNISEHSENKDDFELRPMLNSAMFDSIRKP